MSNSFAAKCLLLSGQKSKMTKGPSRNKSCGSQTKLDKPSAQTVTHLPPSSNGQWPQFLFMWGQFPFSQSEPVFSKCHRRGRWFHPLPPPSACLCPIQTQYIYMRVALHVTLFVLWEAFLYQFSFYVYLMPSSIFMTSENLGVRNNFFTGLQWS